MATRGRPRSSSSQYRKIADLFRERMRTGAWTNGMTLPSVRELGEELKVSRHTIWLALNVLKNENSLLSNGRGRLVLRFAIMGATTTSGVILELIGDNLLRRYYGYVREMQTGIMLGAGEICAPILVAHDNRLRTEIPADLLDFPIKGVISHLSQRKEMLERLARIPRPVVLLDHPPVKQKLHCIAADHVRAIEMCVDKLVARGHRHVVLMRLATASMNDVDADGKALQQAFQSYGRKAGLKSPKHSFLTLMTRHSARSPELSQLFHAKPRYTAVICANEELAHSTIQAAQDRKMKVPGDLSVLALGSALSGDFSLSGPRTNFEAMGRMAVRVIADPTHAPMHQTAPLSWNEGKTL